MRITRRHFLGASMGTASALFSFNGAGPDCPRTHHEREPRCVLVDLNAGCVLPESLAGYQRAFSGLPVVSGQRFSILSSGWRTIIVAGAGLIEPAFAQRLAVCLSAGMRLVIETGSAFLELSEFAAHQGLLQRYFNVAVSPPVDLWDGKVHSRAPYVDYLWPRATKVRDFSRITPLAANDREIIGWAGDVPVALKRRVGRGELIFLGSPIGPALGAGDLEAARWVQSVVAG